LEYLSLQLCICVRPPGETFAKKEVERELFEPITDGGLSRLCRLRSLQLSFEEVVGDVDYRLLFDCLPPSLEVRDQQ
jgi:hypothetical protein